MSDYAITAAKPAQSKMREAFAAATHTLATTAKTGLEAHAPTLSEGLGVLTPKQRKVLSLLSFGYSNKEIAAMLTVAESTIKAHVSAIFHAFGCTNRVQAALIAYSMRQHIPSADLLRSRRLPSGDEVERLSGFFDQ